MKYFTLKELIHPDILAMLTEQTAWMLVPLHVRKGLDALREAYGGTIIINNPPHFVNSGLRKRDETVGAKLSTHKGHRGLLAFDLKCADLRKLRGIVSNNYKDLKIHEIESEEFSKTWCHVAFGYSTPNILKVINP